MALHEIVILGANFGGLNVAHYILRQTIPSLQAVDPSKQYHVTLVGPSKYFYFKVAAPRALADPGRLSPEKAMLPIEEGFSRYDSSTFAFIQGLATALKPEEKLVKVHLQDKQLRVIHYDSLIIATGTTSSPLWTVNDDLTATKNAYLQLHEKIPKAKTLLISGGGPASIETAGEIATKYPGINVTLVTGSDRLLPRLSTATSGRAVSYLGNMGVEVKHNAKVTSATPSKDGTSTRVEFDDGSSRQVDVYISALGGKPNTAFLPPSWLDTRGRLLTDRESLRGPAPGVYGIGDVRSTSDGGIMDIQVGTKPLASSLGRDIVASLVADATPERGHEIQRIADAQTALKDRKFSPPFNLATSQIVPIGPKGGVGQLSGYWMPSFLVYMLKSRDFMIGAAKDSVSGDGWAKA